MWVDPLNHDHAANQCLCMRVCGHLSVCMCTSVYLFVLCVYACVWTSVCVYVHKCVSVCCVCMRVCGHLCVCASLCACGHVRASVCHYYFVMLMCTIFILTITVQFGMDIQYIMIWKVWYCFFMHVCKCCNAE